MLAFFLSNNTHKVLRYRSAFFCFMMFKHNTLIITSMLALFSLKYHHTHIKYCVIAQYGIKNFLFLSCSHTILRQNQYFICVLLSIVTSLLFVVLIHRSIFSSSRNVPSRTVFKQLLNENGNVQ